MRKRFKVYAEGGEIADYQIKKDGKYFSAGMDGNAKWFESPDKGYTYTKEDAEGFAKQLGLFDYEIVKYDKNWWKMADGGEIKQFEVGDNVTFLTDLFVTQEVPDEYDSESIVREGRTLKIIKSDEFNKVYYLKEQGYYKYIIGFKQLDGWLKEKYVKINNGGYMADGGELDWGADLGDGFSIGADVYITDSKSMYKSRTGFISGLAGKDLLVTISEDGNDRSVVVSKKGVEMLDAPEYAEGGMLDYTLTKIESDFNSFKPDGQSYRTINVDKENAIVTAEFKDLGNWINDEEDRYDDDFDESDWEDNDQQIWDNGEYTKYLNKFKAWASPFSWYVNVQLDLDTSEKNWCEFSVKVISKEEKKVIGNKEKWILSNYKPDTTKPVSEWEYTNEEKAIKDVFEKRKSLEGYNWKLGILKDNTVSVFMTISENGSVFITDNKRELLYSLMPDSYKEVTPKNREELIESIETLEMLGEDLDEESKQVLKKLKEKLSNWSYKAKSEISESKKPMEVGR